MKFAKWFVPVCEGLGEYGACIIVGNLLAIISTRFSVTPVSLGWGSVGFNCWNLLAIINVRFPLAPDWEDIECSH